MYSQCATHVSVGASALSLEWTGFCAECVTLSRLGSLTNACVLCCRLICWQRDRAYELYSVLISTLHSDHYIRFLWWRLIALSLSGGAKLYWWGSTTHIQYTHTCLSQDHTRKHASKEILHMHIKTYCTAWVHSKIQCQDALMWNTQEYKREKHRGA